MVALLQGEAKRDEGVDVTGSAKRREQDAHRVLRRPVRREEAEPLFAGLRRSESKVQSVRESKAEGLVGCKPAAGHPGR